MPMVSPSAGAAGAASYASRAFNEAVVEKARRNLETLKLYSPLPFQDKFHACTAKEVILQKGNQAGGSIAGFVEDARAATGRDPYNKYPKENGMVVCVGYGEKHIGTVIHRYLFRPGAFRIIRDLATKQWRVFRPWSMKDTVNGVPGDLERKDESRESEPLIPERMVKNISYDKRSDYVFTMAELTNGWTIRAYNSAGDPHQAQGFQANLVHIDEDTQTPGWHIEMLNRLSMTEGLFRWTALPHMKNDELMGLIERAEDERGKENPTTVLIQATVYDNPYYPKASLEANEKIIRAIGEDAYRQRMLGQITKSTIDMYPTFSKYLHDAIKFDEPRLPVQKILTERNGDPPNTWCLYAVIDPGHVICAVTFWAVPPPQEFGDFKICYDELYIRNCDSRTLATQFKAKAQDKTFHEFIIDAHGGKLTGIADGTNSIQRYTEDFANLGIRSTQTGSGFRYGSDNIAGRVIELRDWLSIRDDGTTKFLIVAAKCPNTITEFGRFKKKRILVNGVLVTTDQGERRNVHAVETCEYAAAHGLEYVRPEGKSTNSTWIDRVLEQRAAYKSRQRGTSEDDGSIRLGPM